MAIGYIPSKITYVLKPKSEQKVWRWGYTNGVPDPDVYEVSHAFPVEHGKPVDTAITWAKSYRGSGEIPDPTILEAVDNAPIQVRIVDIDCRGNGGRAYKAIIHINDNQLYVDLREDVLLDTILDNGIKKGGYLNGEFVWAKSGSQTKLVRVGSFLHETLVKGSEKKKQAETTKIGKKDLQVGTIYGNLTGNHFLYLGEVTYTKVTPKRKSSEGFFWCKECGFLDEYWIDTETVGKVSVWQELHDWNKEKTFLENTYVSLGNKKVSFVVGEQDIPPNPLRVLREHNRNNYLDKQGWWYLTHALEISSMKILSEEDNDVDGFDIDLAVTKFDKKQKQK